MTHNLIPPFILCDAGIHLCDTPKIQCLLPEAEDHALNFAEFRIPLQLHGIFSYFTTQKPTIDLLQTAEEIYMLTPEHFNPHS